MGILPIEIHQLYSRSGIWYVSGENFTPYCRLYGEGKELETTYLSPQLLRLEGTPPTVKPWELEIQVVDENGEILGGAA